MSRPFVHLRVHTEFSLADGIVRTDDLVKTAVRHGMPAVAVTDLANLFGAVKFYQAACAAGVKPLIGADLWLENPADPHKPHRLVLLCQNTEGYRRLCRLLTRAYTDGQHSGRPCLDKSWFEAPMAGLIALSGAHEGDIGQALLSGNAAQAESLARAWQQWFPGCFYLELQRTGQAFQEDYNHAAVELARKLSLPVVATNHAVFLRPEDYDAHEVRVCIQDGRVITDTRRPRRYTQQQYLRSSEEMAELFQDIPEAIENTVEIARRCNLRLELGKYYLPAYPVPEGMTIDELLRRDSQQGLEARLQAMPADQRDAKRAAYSERLELELTTIVKMGFPGYFLIVADFIQWAKHNGIPVGPGRGSGAGSLVAWCLGITELDPIKYDLLFERFLNPERVSLPDFDVDFCIEGRDRVIEYVNNKYGHDRVAQIITHGTMAAKAVVRDVGRVMDQPYGYVDKLAKLIPFEIGMTLERALEIEPQLAERFKNEDDVRDLLDTARALEGLARSAGKHAAGVVIAPSALTDFMPLYCEQGSTQTVTQFDMGDVEAIGLVKFDFLGLRNLTIIDKALKSINAVRAKNGEPPIVIEQLPIDDPATYALIKSARTTALFQLESRGMKDLIQRIQPDSFEEIVALVALFRPGPLQSGMVDDFINRKHKRVAVKYPHPTLEPILKPTYGVILYQEQVMQIARVLSGYTLGGADLLRRAMGKKKPEEMAQQRDSFVTGAAERKVNPKLAADIFDLIEKFAGYGFNRCVVGSTVVPDAKTGVRYTISELFTRRGSLDVYVHALGENWRLRARPVRDVVWNGKRSVYRLRTALGNEIVVTDNHPFRTLDGWTLLRDLKPGDRIAAPRALNVSATKTWPEHELIVLGGLLSEGNTCHPTCLYYYNNDEALIADFARAATRFPNTVARLYKRTNGRYEISLSTGHDRRFRKGERPWNATPLEVEGSAALDADTRREVLPSRSGAFLWAEAIGILDCKADRKRVPEAVFGLTDECIELLLGRMWSGDGFFIGQSDTQPFYATSSEGMAFDVQALLRRLGIVARIQRKHFKYRGGHRPGFAVFVLGENGTQRFVDRIVPHCVGRDAQIAAMKQRLSEIDGNRTSKDTIPGDVRRWVKRALIGKGLTFRDVEAHSGVSMREFYANGSVGKRGFRRATISRLASFFESDELRAIADSDVYWDTVSSIEPQGVDDVYDLVVEEDHNFVADGLIIHNSHSAAYALIAYQTAWLKAHYPAAFMAAVLSSDMDKTDKVVTMMAECRDMKLNILPPDINRCEYHFVPLDDGTILYGLGAIKGLGEAAIDAILQERNREGTFRDLFDFCQRIDLRKVNRRVLESLIKAGALDGLGTHRAALMASLNAALAAADQHSRNLEAGQGDIFGAVAPPTEAHVYETAAEWSEDQRLDGEKETLGLYLTGHPIARYADELRGITNATIAELKPSNDSTVVVAGLVVAIRSMQTRRGDRMAFVTLDDRTGRLELAVFSDLYGQSREQLAKDTLLVVEGQVSVDEYTGGFKMSAEKLYNMDQARAVFSKRLVIDVNAELAGNGFIAELKEILSPAAQGKCPVFLHYQGQGAEAEIVLGDDWKISPTNTVLERLSRLAGESNVHLIYR